MAQPSVGKGVLSVLFVTVFLDLLGFGLIIPILPTYAKSLGAEYWQIGAIALMFPLMQFMFSSFWGALSDRYGRRPIMLGSIFITGLAYIFFAHAATLILLLISRALSGFGAANISVAQAYISDVTTPKNRTKSFGILGAAFGMGFIFGPPIGGFIKEYYGILELGYAAAAFSLLNLVMAYFMLPESLKQKVSGKRLFPNPFKDVYQGLKASFTGSLLFINFTYIAAFSMMQITAALLWEEHYGLSEAEVGYMFSFIGILAVIIQGGLIGRLNKKFGEKKLLIAGNILMIAGLLLMPFVPPLYFMPLEFLALAFLGFGNSFLTPTINTLLANNTDRSMQGKILGTNQSIGSLGRIFGPAVGSAIYGLGYYYPYLAAATIMIFVTFLSWRMVQKMRLKELTEIENQVE